jgi:hypothetical protein
MVVSTETGVDKLWLAKREEDDAAGKTAVIVFPNQGINRTIAVA